MKDTRILLVDDHDLVLQGLKRIVECSLPEIKYICTASTGQEVLQRIAAEQFDLFLLDIELPDMSGLDLIAHIRRTDPQARIIVNTMHEEVWFIKDLLQCNVSGILFKSVNSNRIAEAIRKVLEGQTYYCPYAERVRARMKRSDGGRREELTVREAAQSEIEEFSRALAAFGITFSDVADNCPKQERTLRACMDALNYARWDPEVLAAVEKSGKLPIAELASGSGVERKTLERHRKYMVAMLLAFTNGFEIIRGHLCRLDGGRGAK